MRKPRRLVEDEFLFYKLNSRFSRSAQCANTSEKVLKLNMQRRRSIPNGSISRRGPRSGDDAELGHYSLLFCRGRGKEMDKDLKRAYAQLLIRSSNLLFIDVFVKLSIIR